MSRGMFDETLRYLKQLNGQMSCEMEILPDEDGYIDKECPKEECKSKFKVNADDWTNLFSDEQVYCPFCGHSAPAQSWWTTEQVEQLQEQAIAKLQAGLTNAMKRDAQRFNRSQSRNSLFKLSLSVKGKSTYIELPAKALAEMEQKIQCESCGARYAVIGSAFYCPCCGSNSAKQTFANTIAKVKAKISNIPLIRETVAENVSKDDAERICMSLLESSIPDLVVAFQRLCECVYPQMKNATALKRNVFQRLDDGSKLWVDVCEKGYADWLAEDEYSLLRKCFQQRHLLQHRDGIVDQDYITKSNDSSYMVGQRLIIREEDVLQYCDIINKLGMSILSLI